MNNKYFLVIFSVLFALSFFPVGVQADYYRYDVGNGSWSQYDNGMGSAFYQPITTGRTTYNRDFETTISQLGNNASPLCSNEWCIVGSGSGDYMETTSAEAQNGSNSMLLTVGNTSQVWLTGWNEYVGDANVSFYIKHASGNHFYAGYVNDANSFTQVFDIAQTGGDWNEFTFEVPAGQYRIAFSSEVGGGVDSYYIDNVRVLRNNTGTYRSGTEPSLCGSVNACSNIDYHLPSNQIGNLYYIVEWHEGGTCNYVLNQTAGYTGAYTNAMTEGLNGLFYAKIDLNTITGDYRDINIGASCDKVPFTTTYFFNSTRIHKYRLVDNGSFESTVAKTGDGAGDGCSGNWCIVNSEANEYMQRINTSRTDGRYALNFVTAGSSSATVYSENFSAGGESVSFWVLPGNAEYQYGYVDDANSFTAVGNIANTSDWNYINYNIPAGSKRPAFNKTSGSASTLYIDDISSSGAKLNSTLSVDNNLTNNYGIRNSYYRFTSDYENDYGNDILGADCNIQIEDTEYTASYDASIGYYYDYAFSSNGTYSVTQECASDVYTDRTTTYTVTITTPASQIVTFTPIKNINSYSISDFSSEIDITVGNSEDDIEFSIVSQEDYTPTYLFDMYKREKQYAVYTSTDGVNWTFNESLTYGYSSSYNDPVQKIPVTRLQDEGSFEASIEAGVLYYYQLKPYTIPLYYENIYDSDDWVHYNKPTLYTDGNSVNWDLYQDSNYSNLRSESLKFIPELTSSDFNSSFEFQFTAYASASTDIQIGYTYNGTDVTETVTLTTGKVTYSVPVTPSDYDSKLLIKTSSSSSARIYITNYALIPKAYFMDRLNVYDSAGDDLTAILYGGESDLYVREGYPLIVQTSAYDREGDLKTLRLESLIGSTVVRTYEFDLSDATEEDNLFTWRESIEAIIDLNGYYGNPAGFRTATFRATLINNDGEEVSEQFKTVRLMQYPYFDDDISLFVSPLTNKVGENPEFRLRLEQELPEMFIGFHIRLWDEDSSFASPDYETYVYNDSFNCSFECLKDIVLDEFVYEKEDVYNVNFTVLLSTENEVTDNELTSKTYGYYVTFKEYETARILQAFERSDLTYRNDEQIPIVLQLRDIPYVDLKDRTSVYLTLDLCPADTGACDTNGTTKFLPKFHYYDETTGYNYFYWNNIFFTDSGDLLYDGNYIRMRAHISDKYYSHDTTVIPEATLGSKCADVGFTDIGSFLYNFIASAVTGCTTPASSIIELGDAEETRLIIDADHNVSGVPNQSLWCVKPNNEVYRDTLKQDLYCGVIYKRNEQSIDTFKIYIGNEFSDYTKTGAEKQYIEFTIPAEDVIFNDPYLMQEALNSEYSTDEINTLGEFIYYGLDWIWTGIANPVSEIPTALTDSGFITNVNWDLNFDGQLDPTFVTGFFYIKVEGFEVENQYNYIDTFPELETLNPKNFRTFAIRNNLPLTKKETVVTVYASDMEQIEKLKVSSPIVIYAKPSVSNVDPNALDQNVTRAVIPSTLKFSFMSDMIYNSSKGYDRIHVPLILSQVITQPISFQSIFNWFGDAIENPADWFGQNWFIIVVLIIFVLIVSLVYANFKGGGGVIVNNAPPNINIKRR